MSFLLKHKSINSNTGQILKVKPIMNTAFIASALVVAGLFGAIFTNQVSAQDGADIKTYSKIKIIDNNTVLPAEYAFYPSRTTNKTTIKLNGQVIASPSIPGSNHNKIKNGDIVTASNVGYPVDGKPVDVEIKYSGNIPQTDSNWAALFIGSNAFPGIHGRHAGEDTIKSSFTYSRPVTGSVTFTDIDAKEYLEFREDQIENIYVSGTSGLTFTKHQIDGKSIVRVIGADGNITDDPNKDYWVTVTFKNLKTQYIGYRVAYNIDSGLIFNPKPIAPIVVPARINLKAEKRFDNQVVSADKYEFELLDINNNVISKAKNKADGKIIFDDIVLVRPGSYVYKMKEIIPSPAEPGVSYDTSVKTITVVVTQDDAAKRLTTDISDELPIFNNKTAVVPSESEDLVPGVPNTGAAQLISGGAKVLPWLFGAGAIAYFLRRRSS